MLYFLSLPIGPPASPPPPKHWDYIIVVSLIYLLARLDFLYKCTRPNRCQPTFARASLAASASAAIARCN